MRYWESMNSKYGFSDGNETPVDAELCRSVYVKALNVVAERLGSKVRCVCYDRPGVHNCVLIVMVSVDFFNTLTEDQIGGNDQPPFPEPKEPTDTEWEFAVAECDELGLDEYIIHEVKLSPKFKKALAKIKAGKT